MSDKKQRRLPKIGEKREKRENASDVNPNKKVHTGDVHGLLTSHVSRPVAHRCTQPEIGNGWLLKQHIGIIMQTGSGELVSTHLPPLPVKAVAQQQVKKLSKRSSASRHGFVTRLPAVVKQDYSNKEGSHLRRDRLMPVHLPPTENMTQSSSSSSWSAGHKPDTAVLRPTTGLKNLCRLPDIKNAQVKCSRSKSGNLHRLPCGLPRKEELEKNLKLPPIANAQRAKSPKADIAKKKKKII
ncbi:uncharacterized protein LOC122870978 isoform X2 [Siniperca chuatsi]|uniref:uncharacterized protein LOC122870978 isoform X2 n=1 Tax=Siniperca chuatsi TaxID=119488 RepID=UPI001CE0DBD0|nr:uncharacterized protein LOC122870978 isoform X2 [Siniperca chuatsi]